MNRLSELALTARAVGLGDRRAFSQLATHYTPLLRRFFAMQLCGDMATADDLTQDTLLTAWLRISGFRMTASFRTWIYRIAYNRLVDHLRRRRPELLPVDESLPDNPPPEDERMESVRLSVEQLPPTQRLCVTLHYMQGLSTNEMEEITGLSNAAIRANLSRAVKHLKATL